MKKFLLLLILVFLCSSVSLYASRPVRRSSCSSVIPKRIDTSRRDPKRVTDLHHKRLKKQRNSIDKAMRIPRSLAYVYY